MSDSSTGIQGNNVMDSMKDARQKATKVHEQYGLGLLIAAVIFGLFVLALMVALFRWSGYGSFHAGLSGAGLIIAGTAIKSNKHVGEYTGYVVGIGWIVVVSALLSTGLTNWARETFNSGIESFNEPEPFTKTGSNWLMNPYTGKVFKTEPQNGCLSQGNCFDPNHSDGDGGTDLVPYNAAKVAVLTQPRPRVFTTPKPAPEPSQRVLSPEHYLSSDIGKFPQITLDSTGIIVTDYEKSDLVHSVSGGVGKLAVQYRGAFTGPWTDATLVNGTEIKLKSGDNAWQYRYYTTRGTLKFDLERAEVPS